MNLKIALIFLHYYYIIIRFVVWFHYNQKGNDKKINQVVQVFVTCRMAGSKTGSHTIWCSHQMGNGCGQTCLGLDQVKPYRSTYKWIILVLPKIFLAIIIKVFWNFMTIHNTGQLISPASYFLIRTRGESRPKVTFFNMLQKAST